MTNVTDILLVSIALLLAQFAVVVVLWRRRSDAVSPEAIDALTATQRTIQRAVADSATQMREDVAKDNRAQRQELAAAFNQFRTEQGAADRSQRESLVAALDRFRAETSTTAQATRV